MSRRLVGLIRTAVNLAVLAMVPISLIASAQRLTSESGAAQSARVAGVKFTVPNGFSLDHATDSEFAFMQHETEPLALFVAVAKDKIDDQYLTDLSTGVVSKMLSQHSGFEWKVLRFSDQKHSAYQTSTGATKGLKGSTYVQTDFVVVKVQQNEVVVGSISVFERVPAQHMFDIEGREYSFTGWGGISRLVASITRQK